jgi:hypothetical protein
MFDQLFNRADALKRHSADPLLDEQLRYKP